MQRKCVVQKKIYFSKWIESLQNSYLVFSLRIVWLNIAIQYIIRFILKSNHIVVNTPKYIYALIIHTLQEGWVFPNHGRFFVLNETFRASVHSIWVGSVKISECSFRTGEQTCDYKLPPPVLPGSVGCLLELSGLLKHCIVLYCTDLYCTALYYTKLYYTHTLPWGF